VSIGREAASVDAVAALRQLTARRVRREPMSHIMGGGEFWGLTFHVSADVLTPRPDSETLIEAALTCLPDRDRAWRILDLGLGSGCLLAALLTEFPRATGVGVEASQVARTLALRNLARHGLEGRARIDARDWSQSGWTDGLGGPFDLIVSNPPYIPTAAIAGLMPEVALWEPRPALDGGADGLSAYRALAPALVGLLAPAGWGLFEGGEGQAIEIEGICASAGLSPAGRWLDLGGITRVIGARQETVGKTAV